MLSIALLLAGCGGKNYTERPILKKLVGKTCTVQLDRAILSYEEDSSILFLAPGNTKSKTTFAETETIISGAKTTITGKLEKFDSEWIVLKQKKCTVYILMQNVLLIYETT